MKIVIVGTYVNLVAIGGEVVYILPMTEMFTPEMKWIMDTLPKR